MIDSKSFVRAGQNLALAWSCFVRRCYDCNFPLGNKDLFCPRCGARQRRDHVYRVIG